MQYEEFIGQIQNELEHDSREAGLQSTRAVLTTIGERVQAGQASNLAAPLPDEIGRFLEEVESGQRFDFQTFMERVHERDDSIDDEADAKFHAQAVISLLHEALPDGAFDDLRSDLPDEYNELFALTDQEIQDSE